MMRTISFVVILLGLLLVLSPLTGCGGSEEPPQGEVPAPAEPQVKEAPKENPSEEATVVEASPPSEPPAETEMKAEATGIADVIIIENQGYTEDKKNPVKLNHKKHAEEYGIACDNCHHIYKEGKNTWKQGDPVEKCVVCHDPVADQDAVIKLQSAFHKNCRDCHKEVAQEGREEAPYKKCAACHS